MPSGLKVSLQARATKQSVASILTSIAQPLTLVLAQQLVQNQLQVCLLNIRIRYKEVRTVLLWLAVVDNQALNLEGTTLIQIITVIRNHKTRPRQEPSNMKKINNLKMLWTGLHISLQLWTQTVKINLRRAKRVWMIRLKNGQDLQLTNVMTYYTSWQ